MNTKIIMQASAFVLGLSGILSQFLPTGILNALEVEANSINELSLQLLGALYIGFAILNWMAKDNIIGGVYSRPVSVANLTHFAIGAITLTKLNFYQSNIIIIILTIIYVLFALMFTKIVFSQPYKKAGS